MKKVLFLIIILSATYAHAQEKSAEEFGKKKLNWYNLDPIEDKALGSSVTKAYQELLPSKKTKKTIVIAVIDSGVDVNHDDLKGQIWVNSKEIAGNGIDDDKNGYVDDVNGWNFIGNANGENVAYENYEYTRIYRTGPSNEYYQKAKEMYEKEYEKRTKEKENLDIFAENIRNIKTFIQSNTGVFINKKSDLYSVFSDNPNIKRAVNYLTSVYEKGYTDENFKSAIDKNNDQFTKHLNLSFNPRAIVGDDPSNINDKSYGNADVIGQYSSHGTRCAGIIAGVRNNGIGIDGIATDAKIMVLRVVPNGDERDKDVALAIRYAVENGADIINMSFGKALSPQRKFVDDAIKFAEQKNVLLVHGAGNDGENVDIKTFFPSDCYIDSIEATNFIQVASVGRKKGKSMVSVFSNYGQNHVDIFAPGEEIVSTDTSNTYSMENGTSFSAPVVSGVAALILSYNPELTPKELIAILMESSHKFDNKVYVPNNERKGMDKAPFTTLSKSGGIVNAYDALKLVANRPQQ